MLSPRQKFIKNLTLPLAMLVFILLFAVDIFFVPAASSSSIKFLRPQDQSISGNLAPRIDGEAAAVVKEDNQIIPLCRTLPGELWILLLAAYIFLLFFNLFYDFEQSGEIHPVRSPSRLEQDDRRLGRLTSNGVHWFWEGFYTLLALIGWYAWDTCHYNIWFPLYVMKLGIIVYSVYLYLFYKKKELQPLSDEDLENFEG